MFEKYFSAKIHFLKNPCFLAKILVSLAKLINEIWCNNDVPNSIIRFSCLCVVLHPHQEPQKEASALLIHHQIGNFLIAASKFAFIGFSLPPLRAVRGEKKQASNCLTRPPIEPYWLDKAQLNSLQGNPTIKQTANFLTAMHKKNDFCVGSEIGHAVKIRSWLGYI